MAVISPVPKLQFFDANGNPLAGGKLYSYVAGTTTPQATFTDAGGGTPNTNPVILDSRGEASVWLDSSAYKLKLATATDVEVWTVDNVAGAATLAQLAASGGSALIGFLQAGTGAVERTAQAKMRDVVSVKDFGAVCDGVTDDTVAVQAAISYQQTTGCILELPDGAVIRLASWSTMSLSSPFYMDGRQATLRCANATRVAFITARANFDIRNTKFDGWYRVINNPSSVTQSITNAKFLSNECVNASVGADKFGYYVLIQNPVSNLWIENNKFTGALGAAIVIGDNVYANQDTWQKIYIKNNTIDTVSMTVGPAFVFGVLVYGRDVLIEGNDVNDVQTPPGGYSASNGAYGIYTKSRYTRIIGNNVRQIGVGSTNADWDQIIGINVKGDQRGATSTPQGFDSLVEGNTVVGVGTIDTYGTGVSSDHSGTKVVGNIIEAGRRGIGLFDGGTASTDSHTIIGNTCIVGPGGNCNAIEVFSNQSQTIISENDCTGYVGIRIRGVSVDFTNGIVANNSTSGTVGIFVSADVTNLSNVSIQSNLVKTGSFGAYLYQNAGGVLSDVMVCDNDFSACATPIGVVGVLSGVRIRNNRGYVSENGGVTGAIATGTTVSHGCAVTPTIITLAALTAGPTNVYVTAIGTTTFTVNFGGGGTHVFAWEAKTPYFYA